MLQLRLIAINLLLFPSLTFGHTITSSNDHQCNTYFHNGDRNKKVKYCYSRDNLFTSSSDDMSRSGYVTITYLSKGDIRVPIDISNNLGRKAFLHSKDFRIDEEILDGSTRTVVFEFFENNDRDNSQTLFINGESIYVNNDKGGVVRVKVATEGEVELKYKTILIGDTFCRVSVVDAVGEMHFSQDSRISRRKSAMVQYDTNIDSTIRFNVDKDKIRYLSAVRNEVKHLVSISEDKIFDNTKEVYYSYDSLNYERLNMSNGISDDIIISKSGYISFVPIVDLNKSELLAGKYSMKATVTCN
ncbi:hypothetical protein [Vibrio mimicus]|uniref:hypothetical protein n=1 Tax=Vibrio mimicus TaxID=674 RepID=UPI001F182881|nr:hypothetical protein [Vibrio mimicus]